jgi:Protein of unknown function (DUF3606)
MTEKPARLHVSRRWRPVSKNACPEIYSGVSRVPRAAGPFPEPKAVSKNRSFPNVWRYPCRSPSRPIRPHIETHDVKHWSKHWKVTPEQIRAAIKKVGNSVAPVQKELGCKE